ncbi:MAG: hypothetical protein AAB683_01605 [Patescibacteria group bacterium]
MEKPVKSVEPAQCLQFGANVAKLLHLLGVDWQETQFALERKQHLVWAEIAGVLSKHLVKVEKVTDQQESKVILTDPVPLIEPTEKFTLLVDLGIITVPEDYDHATQLAKFKVENEKKFQYGYDKNITDANFPTPSRILKPGDKFRIKAFIQTVARTTSEEHMAFLVTQKAVHLGAQGASLVFDQKRTQLPKSRWYASFDEKECLWEDAGASRHRITDMFAHLDDGFEFSLGCFEGYWGNDDAFFCFCDVE